MTHRPSLETISQHPFFTHDTKKIPKSLPSCCTHVAPDWQEDAHGQLVPVLAESEESVQRAKAPTRSRGESNNGRYGQYVDSRQRPNEVRREDHKRNGAEKFEIYDDKHHRQHEQFDSGRRKGNYRSRDSGRHQKIEDDQIAGDDTDAPNRINNPSNKGFDEVTKKLAACDIQGLDEKMTTENFTGSDNDMNALEKMLSRINGAFGRIESTGAPLNFKPISPSQRQGAQKWVTRYVDYTSKYGLGFLLNDKR